jgi:hypothetical protein
MTAGRRTAEALAAHQSAREWLGAAGFLAVGGAVTLALGGVWVGAAACAAAAVVLLWLIGVWLPPRGADAYVRRVTGAMGDWRTETEHPGGHIGSKDRALHRLERARPPQRAAAEHERLVAAFTANEEAERALTAAELHDDRAAVGPARARADATYASLCEAYDALIAALGDDLRWPPEPD